MKRKGGAFSLVEIVVMIAIIAVLSVTALVIFINIRNQIGDLQRLHDIRQLQNSLERYASDNGGNFPNVLVIGQPLISPNGTVTYMSKVPSNPEPRTAAVCANRDYDYRVTSKGKSYLITYCLVKGNSQFDRGECHAMPGVPCIQNSVCSCNDINKYCCGFCDAGAICGGGQLYAKNFSESEIINYDLVVSPAGCDPAVPNNPPCVGFDKVVKKWSDSQTIADPAIDPYDGLANTNALINQKNSRTADNYPAAKYCADLVFSSAKNQFTDWYLPSQNELDALYAASKLALPTALGFNPGYYWASNQDSAGRAWAQDFPAGTAQAQDKTADNYVRCIRR